jgi:hypothetical protein
MRKPARLVWTIQVDSLNVVALGKRAGKGNAELAVSTSYENTHESFSSRTGSPFD